MKKAARRSVVVGFALLLGGVLAGCSKDSGGTPTPPPPDGTYLNFCLLPAPCQMIAQACHPKDDGSPGAIHNCHVIGHEIGTLAACQPKLNSCLTTCNAAPPLSDAAPENLYAPCVDGGLEAGATP